MYSCFLKDHFGALAKDWEKILDLEKFHIYITVSKVLLKKCTA